MNLTAQSSENPTRVRALYIVQTNSETITESSHKMRIMQDCVGSATAKVRVHDIEIAGHSAHYGCYEIEMEGYSTK
jgi:hypothetical protein